jgi:hypothetical protein
MAWLPTPENIATGWSPGIKYDAPNIAPLVGDILKNRLATQEFQQKQFSDLATKIQQQRAGNAALEQAKAMGLEDPGALAGLGAQGLTAYKTLADLVREKQQQDALANYHEALANRYWQDPTGTADQTDPSADLQTQLINGILHYWNGKRWVPYASPLQQPSARPQNVNQLESEENKLLQQQMMLEQQSRAEEKANREALRPNVPFSQADLYNRNKERLEEIRRQRTMPHADQPQTQTDTTDQPDQTQISTQGTSQLGPDAQKRILAQQALDDPNATAAEKAQARLILGQ